MAARATSSPSEAVNLLALDGGGIRGISELLILNEIMRRIQYDQQLADLPRPCDYFDLMGGTSTGGLIALLLGRLRMRTDEAIAAYNKLASAIFSKENKKWKGQDGLYKATTLEEKVKEVVANANRGSQMLDSSGSSVKGKAFVCAMPARNMEYPRRFRTYPVRALASANCEIWEAARATSAAPTIFKRVEISDGQGAKEHFVDGGLRCNNPTNQLLQEARDIFGNDRAVGCVVSIGTGYPGTIGLAQPDAFQKWLPTNLINVLQKIATDCESTSNDLEARFQDHDKLYFRLNVDHGAEGISMEEWKRMGELTEHTNAYLQRVSVSKMIDSIVEMLCSPTTTGRTLGSLNGILQTKPSPIESKTSVEKSTASPKPSILPHARCTHFVTRKLYQEQLSELFFRSNSPESRAALCGLGGVGKTQIALDFVLSRIDEYSIFWMRADRAENLLTDLSQVHDIFADSAESSTSYTPHQMLQRTRSFLEARSEEWIMVLDNVDNLDLFRTESINNVRFGEFIPRRGRILVTSRDVRVAGELVPAHCGITVQPMSLKEAEELLALSLPSQLKGVKAIEVSSNEDTIELVQDLGCLPLAISQAAANMRHYRMDLHEYVSVYQDRKKRPRLLDEPVRELGQTPQSVLLTWEISFERLRDSFAAHILCYIAFFHWQSIPPVLLRCLPKIEDLDDLDFSNAIGQLLGLSLVDVSPSGEYNIHPLVHQWASSRLSDEEKVDYMYPVLSQMASLFPDNPWRQKSLCQFLLPHALELVQQAAYVDIVSRSFARLLQTMAHFLREIGIHDWSIKLLEQSLEIAHQVWDANDISLIYIRKYYARSLARAGQHHNAISQFDMCLHNLETVEASAAERQSEQWYIRRDCSHSLRNIGKLDESMEMVRPFLDAVRTGMLGEEDKLATMGLKQSVIMWLFREKKYDEAKPLVAELKELAATTNFDDLTDPSFELTVMRDEAHLLLAENQRSEALAIYYDAFRRTLEIVDPTNENFYVNATSVADLLIKMRRHEEAIAVVDRVFGLVPDKSLHAAALLHASALLNLKGVALIRIGHYSEAEAVFRTTTAWDESLNHAGSPGAEEAVSTYHSVSVGLYNLALSLAMQGRIDAAKEIRKTYPKGIAAVEEIHGTLEARLARLDSDHQIYEEAKEALSKGEVHIGDTWWSGNSEALERAEDMHGRLEAKTEAGLLETPPQTPVPGNVKSKKPAFFRNVVDRRAKGK